MTTGHIPCRHRPRRTPGHTPRSTPKVAQAARCPWSARPAAPDCPARGHRVNGKLSADAVGHVPVVRRFVQRLLVF